MNFRTPVLTETELKVHLSIDELRVKLSYAVPSRRWLGLLSRVLRARAIQGSNSIEGYNVTMEDALGAVDGEEPLDASSETWMAVTGYRDAMTYVLQLADDKHFGYSTDLLRSLHYTMTKHDLSKHPGRWRPGTIFVQNEATQQRVYEVPDIDIVPALMGELVAELNSQESPLAMVTAAMAHLNLVMIHPFSDGNGRMARCLQSLVLARDGTLAPQFSSIEEYLGRNTPAYYDVLASVGHGNWNPERDATDWIRFCLTAHFRQAVTLLRRVKELGRMWDALEEVVAQRRLPERAVFALADAAQGFRVTNSRYRSVVEVSQNLASRDLSHFAKAGLLEPHGERRGRYYIASAYTTAIRQKTRELRTPIPDPFTENQLDSQVALFAG